MQEVALRLFERGTDLAKSAGFVLADTKYEFGLGANNELLLIDEVHTPDSSRFWAASSLEERLAQGVGPESFDKEPVRLALRAAGFTGDGPVPELDQQVWGDTSARYVKIFESLTGTAFSPGRQPAADRLASNLQPFLESSTP